MLVPIYTAIGFLSLTAILGLYLISFVLTSRETPKGVMFAHGLLATVGLVLLVVYTLGSGPDPIASLVLFLLAALGGFFMAFRDLTGHKVPKWIAVGHGLTAVLGFVFLVVHTVICS